MPSKEQLIQEIEELRLKLKKTTIPEGAKFSSCACALASSSALESLNHAQTSMWSGTATPGELISMLSQIKNAIKSVHDNCEIPVSQLYKDIDEIRVKINIPDSESAANQIADLRIALLDDLFMCAGGHFPFLDIRSSDRLPTEETDR